MRSALVVRKYDAFSRILEENGFEVANCPAIETVAFEKSFEIDAEVDGVFITSRKAAEVFSGVANFAGRVYVLGRSSFDVLKDRGFDLFFDGNANTASEMMAGIPSGELKGKRFVFVRGEESLRTVPEFLKGTATVDELVVYRTEPIRIDRELANRQFGWICFFSPSAGASFVDQLGLERLKKSKIAVIGATTAEFFGNRGIGVDFVASRATAESFANELIKGEVN